MTGQFSSANSTQVANANITQQYAGTCNVNCDNTISNVQESFIDSIVSGGINFTQTCSVNANCLFQTTQSSLADVIFKAANSSSAAGGLLPGLSASETSSYQDINESILQSITQSCALSSYNDINNVSIYAQSSQIGGGVNFTQSGSTSGSCTFDTLMQATEEATGTSDNCSASGKSAKKSCGGKGSGIGTILLYGGIAIVIFVGVMLAHKMMAGPPTPTTATGGATGKTGATTATTGGTSVASSIKAAAST